MSLANQDTQGFIVAGRQTETAVVFDRKIKAAVLQCHLITKKMDKP